MGGGGNANTIEAMMNAMKGITNSTTKSIASLPSNPGAAKVVDTGATPPSGSRPTGSTQFYQPVYHPSYENYRLPGTPDVSAYGVGAPSALSYAPQQFMPTMPTAQQAMGTASAAPSQGIAALPVRQQ